MGLTPNYEIVLLYAVCGAFLVAFLVSLLPLSTRARVRLAVAGPVGAVVAVLFGNPQGLDGIGWSMIAGAGVVVWFAGLAVGYLLHVLLRRREAAGSPGQ